MSINSIGSSLRTTMSIVSVAIELAPVAAIAVGGYFAYKGIVKVGSLLDPAAKAIDDATGTGAIFGRNSGPSAAAQQALDVADANKKDLKDVHKELDGLETHVDNIDEDLKGVHSDINKIEGTQEEHGRQIAKHDEQIKGLRDDVDGLAVQQAVTTANLNALTTTQALQAAKEDADFKAVSDKEANDFKAVSEKEAADIKAVSDKEAADIKGLEQKSSLARQTLAEQEAADIKVASGARQTLADSIVELDKRLSAAQEASRSDVDAIRARVEATPLPNSIFGRNRYLTSTAKDPDLLLATYPTYFECSTGYSLEGLHKGGAQVLTHDSAGNDFRVSDFDRVRDCLALQAYMDTDRAQGKEYNAWRDIPHEQWDAITKKAQKIATGRVDFGFDPLLDPELVKQYDMKAKMYTSDYEDAAEVAKQRPFLNMSASSVVKYGILDSWLGNGRTDYEIDSAVGERPTPRSGPNCGPDSAAGDGSYLNCDTNAVEWLPGQQPEWAKTDGSGH